MLCCVVTRNKLPSTVLLIHMVFSTLLPVLHPKLDFNKTHVTTSQQHTDCFDLQREELYEVLRDKERAVPNMRVVCSTIFSLIITVEFVKTSCECRRISFLLQKRGGFYRLVCQSGIRIFRTERRGENENGWGLQSSLRFPEVFPQLICPYDLL